MFYSILSQESFWSDWLVSISVEKSFNASIKSMVAPNDCRFVSSASSASFVQTLESWPGPNATLWRGKSESVVAERTNRSIERSTECCMPAVGGRCVFSAATTAATSWTLSSAVPLSSSLSAYSLIRPTQHLSVKFGTVSSLQKSQQLPATIAANNQQQAFATVFDTDEKRMSPEIFVRRQWPSSAECWLH